MSTFPVPYPVDIRPLTSLRFFAALVVVFHHLGYFMPPAAHEVTDFLQKGYLGVDFFFILSGFILVHVYSEKLQAGHCTARSFYVRRFARIYPLHLLTLLLMVPLFYTQLGFGFVGDSPDSFPVRTFLDHLLMIHAWGMESTLRLNAPSWSISAEWFAYLFFPIFMAVFSKFKPGWLLVCLCTIFSAAWLLSYSVAPERPLTMLSVDFGIFRVIPEFAIGMVLYQFFGKRAPLKHASGFLLLCTVTVIALMHWGAPDLMIVFCFAAIIVLAADMSRVGKKMSGRLFVWLGEISYAVYMTHYIVMTVILWGAWKVMAQAEFLSIYPLLALAVIVVTIGFSAALYHGLEKPARRWITGKLSS